MKKIIVVMVMSLAMLLIVAFTCYGIDACYQKNDGQLRILTHNKDCDKDCDKGHNKDCDKDHNKDCDKDGYTNKCKPSEIPISWNQIGPPGPPGKDGKDGAPGVKGLNCWDLNGNGICDLSTEDINKDGKCDALDCKGVANGSLRICSGDINCYLDTNNVEQCSLMEESCLSEVAGKFGVYEITFDKPFGTTPTCVIQVRHDLYGFPVFTDYNVDDLNTIYVYTFRYDGSIQVGVIGKFTFICTQGYPGGPPT